MKLRLLDITLFAAFMMLLFTKALVDLDVGWDNLNYHLPFAAMRSGIFGDEFRFSGWLTGFYEGFPPLHDLIRGYAWKLTGYMNAVNLLNVVVFLAFVVTLHWLSGTPLTIIALAIAAIPTIHTELVGGHVDNLSNLPFALALAATFLAAVQDRRDSFALYCVAVASLVFAANVRLQFVFLSSLAYVPISAIFWAKYVRQADRDRRALYYFVFALGGLAIAWLPIRNAFLFGNPLYPIDLNILGWHLPGHIIPDNYSGPRYLQTSPHFIKWLLSVSEYRAFSFRPNLYTVAQGDVPITSSSFRMGGYLFIYVVISISLFIALALRQPPAKRYWILCVALGLTIFVSAIPSSYELRYFSFWMVGLVAWVLCMLWADPGVGQLRLAYAAVCAGAFFFVASGTGYFFIFPQGFDLNWVESQVKFDEKVASRIHPNTTYCVVGFGKYALALAPKFHPELEPYRVFIAITPEECQRRPILAPQ